MKSIPPMKAVMTPFPYWIEIGSGVDEARRMMSEHDIHHLPVMKQGQLVSVITQSDVNLATDPTLIGKEVEPRVRDLCKREAYVVELTQPLDTVLMYMSETRHDCALVTKDGRLVGIFTISDACRSFGNFLRTLFPRGGNDDAA